MIYSNDIRRICALCRNSDFIPDNDTAMHCRLRGVNVDKTKEDCDKFEYDIFKKSTRRKKRLNTNLSAEDFTL